MCLFTVHKKTQTAKSGWKVFDIFKGHKDYDYVCPEFFRIDKNQPIPTERWLEDPCEMFLKAKSGELYRTGFHVFKTKTQAKRWKSYGQVVCEVLIDNIVASGLQEVSYNNSAIVFVAKKIFIKKPY